MTTSSVWGQELHRNISTRSKGQRSIDGGCGIKVLRSLYEHLQARILEMIETLDDLRSSAEMKIFRAAEEDECVSVVSSSGRASGSTRCSKAGCWSDVTVRRCPSFPTRRSAIPAIG